MGSWLVSFCTSPQPIISTMLTFSVAFLKMLACTPRNTLTCRERKTYLCRDQSWKAFGFLLIIHLQRPTVTQRTPHTYLQPITGYIFLLTLSKQPFPGQQVIFQPPNIISQGLLISLITICVPLSAWPLHPSFPFLGSYRDVPLFLTKLKPLFRNHLLFSVVWFYADFESNH